MKINRKVYLAASVGNILEFYDFALYGFYAGTLSTLFFPLENSLNSLLFAYGVFAVGFLSRPIGAMIFGMIGDKLNRKTSLSLSLSIIAVATTAIGLLPTYATWGIAAPICLVMLRIVQGICIGGEYSNSLIFVSEYLEKYRSKYPAFTTGMVSSMGVLGWFLASLVGMFFKNSEALLSSWRVPFLLGSVVGILGYYIRKHTEDAYDNTRHSMPFSTAFKEVFRFPRLSLQVCSIGILMGALFYGQFIFFYSFLPTITELSSLEISRLISIGIFSYMVFLPLIGWAADHLGHKKIILFSCVLSFFLSPLLFYLATTGVPGAILLSQVISALLLAALMAPGTYYMSLVFPSHIRCAAASINYNLGATLFGGTAPSISLILYRTFDNPIAPALFLALAALIAGSFLCSIKPYTLERHLESA